MFSAPPTWKAAVAVFVPSNRRDLEAAGDARVDAEGADFADDAVVRIAGRQQLVRGRIDVEQRRAAGRGEVVRVTGFDNTHTGGAADVQRSVGSHRARVDIDAQVLARVTHHPQAVDHRIEVDAEVGAGQGGEGVGRIGGIGGERRLQSRRARESC